MKFKDVHLKFFGAVRGAFSVVTNREVDDSQITATGEESDLLIAYYEQKGEPILVGNVSSCPEKAMKVFRHFPNGSELNLNLVFPKPARPELRLYLASRRGFKPEAGSVWFVYEGRDGNLWLGSMDREEWASLGLGRIELRVHTTKPKPSEAHTGLYEEDGVVYLDVMATSMHTHRFRK